MFVKMSPVTAKNEHGIIVKYSHQHYLEYIDGDKVLLVGTERLLKTPDTKPGGPTDIVALERVRRWEDPYGDTLIPLERMAEIRKDIQEAFDAWPGAGI